MNRLSLVLISSLALMFAACGDSGNGASPQSNADMEVRTYSELPSCAEKRDGKTAYVADQEQGYVCQNGEWVEDDDVKVVSVTQSDVEGFLTDSRDGQSYRTVTIGTQTWMAQNLNYKTANSYCYDDSPSGCTLFGRLYTWAAAKAACPTGWHLPAYEEFKTLFTSVGGSATAGTKLKSTSGWYSSGNGTDDYSFSALPAGNRNYNGNYYDWGLSAFFWSSTESNSSIANIVDLDYDVGSANLDGHNKNDGLSVRCVKDNASSSGKTSSSSAVIRSSSSIKVEVNTGSITDSRDGQTYKTVSIGTQTWMAQNLNYETANSYCYGDTPSNCSKYGRLYTWAAAKTACPTGWHLPTQTEWETLFTAVGGSGSSQRSRTAGTKLKSTSGWNDYNGKNGNGTDDYSFSALPAGNRNYNGNYYDEGYSAFFWCSTEQGSDIAFGMGLDYNSDDAYLYCSGKSDGLFVRCVKD